MKKEINVKTSSSHRGDYYPFGMTIPGSVETAGLENKNLYNSKELVDDHNLNWYHYGARYYDPQLGRWWQVDPADEQYSPYTYCANNPICALDPDGKYLVFINGQHDHNPGFNYWDKGQFAMSIAGKFPGEGGIFRDGSVGGWVNTVTSGLNLSSEYRKAVGEMQGKEDASIIFASLADEENKTIRIITHSMGTAYARGYVKSLMAYAEENGIEGVEYKEVDIAAFQGSKLPKLPGVKTSYMKGGKDIVADGVASDADIPKAEFIPFIGWEDAGHSLSDYPEEKVTENLK